MQRNNSTFASRPEGIAGAAAELRGTDTVANLSSHRERGIDLNGAQTQRPEDHDARPALFDAKELKRKLSERADDWVPAHFPRGRISADRSEWRTANTHGDA